MLRRMNAKSWKMTLAGASVACAFGLIAWRLALATPPTSDFTPTHIVGPVLMDEIDTKSETDDHEVEIKAKGMSDVYMTSFKIAPGGHGGWHSHPGPSFIAVKSGTATVYCACEDPIEKDVYPAGTGFVEDAYCVHIVVNEGDTDLEFAVLQIVPVGAPRRIDEPAP